MASTGLRGGGEAPKVVQIETRYVETDATNFKEVVQSFTGKNSSTAWIGRNNNSEIKEGTTAINGKPPEEGAKPDSMLMMNNVSFKDFDTLLLELPPMAMEGTSWF